MKLNITRIFDTAKAFATKSGQELQDFVSYTAEAFTQIIAALRNGLTFEDNINCLVSQPTVMHDVTSVINTNGKRPQHVILTRCPTTSICTGFGWQFNDQGQVTVRATFSGSPATPVQLTLVILF